MLKVGIKMDVFGFALKWRECKMHMQYKDWPNLIPRIAAGMSIRVGEEFIPILKKHLTKKTLKRKWITQI